MSGTPRPVRPGFERPRRLQMPKTIFLNLPVADLAASVRFYEAIGCEKHPQFSDETTVSMVWSDTITFMLLSTDRFAGFSPRPVADAHKKLAGLVGKK